MEQVKKVIEKYGKVVSDVNFYSIVDNHRGLKFDLQIDFLGGTRSSLKNDKILIASSENTDFFGNVTELKNYMACISISSSPGYPIWKPLQSLRIPLTDIRNNLAVPGSLPKCTCALNPIMKG